jgi:chromosome segregation protein
LRWVLGEQNARALRGARMEDVIFNGTDQRKALGMAEVSLTIDNHDHALPTEHPEVTLTRRTYRSGESEYLLNKVPCRLRDIHDLISGTGIGTNAYSFLEQGKIDLIVSSKPADRRFVFEEAAGISKYKSRKEESLRKLENTEQNYLRVNDIAVEVKRQIGTLERQAQKARRYQDLKQELTTLEVHRGRQELRERRQALRKLEQAWSELCVRLQAAERERGEREAAANACSQEQVELEGRLAEAQDTLHRVNEEILKAEEFIASSALRRQDLQLGIERGEHELADAVDKEAQLQAAAAGIRANQETKTAERQKCRDALAAAESRLASLEEEMKARALRVQNQQNQLLQVVDKTAALRGSLQNLAERGAEHEQRLAQLDARLSALHGQREQSVREKATLDSDWQGLQTAMTGLQAEQAALAKEKESLEHTLATLVTMLDNFTKTITQLTSRLHWIEELKNGLDGYESGAKAILLEHNANPERFPGVIGPVANFLRAEQRVEFALEALLGHKLQSILIQTQAQAEEALAFLAEGNRGRATFIPVEHYAGRAANLVPGAPQSWLQWPGVVGRARDLAKIDERFRAIFDALIGEAVIVSDLATVQQARTAGVGVTLVTLNGEVDTAERWLTGGSADISERGLLGREREIEELTLELALLQKNLAASEAEAATIRDRLAEINGGLAANNAELHEFQIRAAKLDKSLERVTGQFAETEQQVTAVAGEREQSETALAKVRAEQGAAATALAELEALDRRTQEELAQQQAGIESLQAEHAGHAERAGDLRIAAAALAEQLSGLDAEAGRLRTEIGETQARIREKRAEIDGDRGRSADLEEQGRLRQESLGRLNAEQAEHSRTVAARQAEKQALQEKKGHYARELKNLQQALDSIRQDQHQLELERKQLEYNLRSLEDYLQTEYHLTLSEQDETPPPDEPAATVPGDPAQASARIQEIKDKLTSLGAVNLVAMEEYNELGQRYEFLSKQLGDLKESKESLQRLITKINQESRARFAETFGLVRERFHEVFRRLFNGGEADLILVDENTLLEPGIEIIARPPGKRLQNITLLSGGEKALTAIALLFAIYLIKPSPFCIFDEMDAPLDDTNTLRFSKILKEFAKKSQFIVITHNKITMEAADVLYGVTMQEAGVSKLVSARFKGVEKPLAAAPSPEAVAEHAAMN